MKNKIYNWWNRKWSNWEVFSEDYKYDCNRNTDWKRITTLKRTSNEGLIRYKVIKNY